MKIECTFEGRLNGAIGITYEITEILEVDSSISEEQIRLKLYDKYERISKLYIKSIE